MELNKYISEYDGKFYFCGNELSKREIEENRVSYATLSKFVGNMLLCNNIYEVDELIYDNLESGEIYNEEYDEYGEIYQFYLTAFNDYDLDIMRDLNEIVFYSEKLDLYVWGITHFGTAWNGVNTSWKIDLDKA